MTLQLMTVGATVFAVRTERVNTLSLRLESHWLLEVSSILLKLQTSAFLEELTFLGV